MVTDHRQVAYDGRKKTCTSVKYTYYLTFWSVGNTELIHFAVSILYFQRFMLWLHALYSRITFIIFKSFDLMQTFSHANTSDVSLTKARLLVLFLCVFLASEGSILTEFIYVAFRNSWTHDLPTACSCQHVSCPTNLPVSQYYQFVLLLPQPVR